MKLKSTQVVITLEDKTKLSEDQEQELRKMFPKARIVLLRHYEEVSELTEKK